MHEYRIRCGSLKISVGAANASWALRVVGVLGKALASVAFYYTVAALKRHWMELLRTVIVLKLDDPLF